MNDTHKKSGVSEKITNFTTPLVFFTLELNKLPDDHLCKLLDQNPDLARYKPVFDRIRAMKPYQLSDELEKFLHDLGVVGAGNWLIAPEPSFAFCRLTPEQMGGVGVAALELLGTPLFDPFGRGSMSLNFGHNLTWVLKSTRSIPTATKR